MNAILKSINPAVYVVVGIFITAAAQILLKIGSSYEILKSKWLLYLFLSLCCYAVSFVAYFLALKSFDISKISPIMMSSIICIITVYGFLSGEQINMSRLFGIALAIVSIFFIYKS